MKIDLHVHTKERSSCGQSTEEEQIRAAIEVGLDAIVFTDHDRLAPPGRLQELNERYAPFRIFGGIEISIVDINFLAFEHILVLGVHDAALEKGRWLYADLYRFVRKHGGFMTIAHPFRFYPDIRLDLEQFPPDAMEAYSNNTPKQAEERILNLAAHFEVPVLSNSDAHHASSLGHYYNILAHPPANDQELINILKSGQFRCVAP